MGEEYVIEKITDLLNVPADKWDGLLADVRSWMQLRFDMARDFGPLIEAGLLTLPERMTWIADGRVGLRSLNVTIEIGHDGLPTDGSEG